MIIIIIDAMTKRKNIHGDRDIFLTDILIRKVGIERILRRREKILKINYVIRDLVYLCWFV